jgi:hypothetical protein
MARYTPAHIKKENQYTDGSKFMLMDYVSYTGYYNVTATGPYTGRVFDEGTSKPLRPLVVYDSETIRTYIQLAEANNAPHDYKFNDPYYVVVLPDEDDFQRGYMIRYFIRKRNDISAPILEIDKEQYEKYESKDEGINPFLYKAIAMKWKVTGPKTDILGKEGKLLESGIEDTNKRTVASNSKTIAELHKIIYNFVEYSKYDESYRGD